MGNFLNKPYEISLWDEKKIWVRQGLVEVEDMNEDKYVPGKFFSQNIEVSAGVAPYTLDYKKYNKDQKYYKYDGKTELEKENAKELEGEWDIPSTILHYFKERKLCVIGSDTMDTPIRAFEPKLVSNINGSNTLTFSMNSKYWDEDSDKFLDNPFIKLLVNERKIKLRYGEAGADDCEWYDLIIKDVQENSESKVFEYVAKDQFINELSKSGFELVLDAELENNMGNITKLAEKALEGSDWKLGDGSSILEQTKEEPLYRIVLKEGIKVKDMRAKKDDDTELFIGAEEVIYGFYSVVNNQESFFQLLYEPEEKFEYDSDHVIINTKNYYLENVTYNDNKPKFASSMDISSTYRGDKLVRQERQEYDSTIDKYVYVYSGVNGEEIYGYTESEYLSPEAVSTYITSGSGFTSTSGWEVGGVKKNGATEYPKLEVQGFPDLRDVENIANQKNYISLLKYEPTLDGQVLFNSGVLDHRSQINGFAKDEEYIFRIKYAFANLNSAGRVKELTYIENIPDIKIGFYNLSDGVYTIEEVLFDTKSSNENPVIKEKDIDGYLSVRIKCSKAISYSDMLKRKIGVFINLPVNKSSAYYLEDVQFFKYVTYEKDGQTVMAVPGGELISSVKTKYFYYYPSKEYKSIDDVNFVYEGYTPQYTQVYNDNKYEKIRSITARESNRFNIIQTLCEIFECWPKFFIEHDKFTGQIKIDKEDGYRQQKFLTFHEYIGNENYAGFKYGINLKSIRRNLESDGIVSKLIVKNNSNEFAKSGFCSISDSSENPIGENYIYDFSYYIQQGLLNFNEVNNDFYLTTNGYIGYYKKLRDLNKNRTAWIDEQSGLAAQIPRFESSYQTYKVSVEEAEEEIRAIEQEIIDLTGLTYTELCNDKNNKWWEEEKTVARMNSWALLKSTIIKHTELYKKAEDELNKARKRYDELNALIENLAVEKKALNLQFYKKYSRFIQEGSWIDENYVDENLYYLDAESTLHTSAQPKVSYDISVLELSQLEGYENYKFSLGDKTYIEDTEFFGWDTTKSTKTPYREEIVVTERAVEFDSPEKNAIKVQNYKTQFEDLFQRVAATTQAVEYHTGEFTRAANTVETDGTINVESLQNSILNNSIRLQNAKDQTVIWDESGITTSSISKPNEIVRLVSGGVFLSDNGGESWNTGITGSGINANYITSGQINTNVINIMNGAFPTFRWDGAGLNAYSFGTDENGKPMNYINTKFVRFDQYGIYGINGDSKFDPNVKDSKDGKEEIGEEKIWRDANYALTWKGFMLKNDDGSVRITSEDDIQVMKEGKERIKIGRLRTGEDLYGISIKNKEEQVVMETDSDGELWLKNRLRVGTDDTSTVEIGYLGVREGTNIHEVIHAGDDSDKTNKESTSFIVYEDGQMEASGAIIKGGIYADYGQIGDLTIAAVEDTIKNLPKITITPNAGSIFKVSNETATPNQLSFSWAGPRYVSSAQYAFTIDSNNTPNNLKTVNKGEEIKLTYNDFKELKADICYLFIKAQDEGQELVNWHAITRVMDGVDGINGKDGTDGKDGIDGIDGTNSYFYILYSEYDNGQEPQDIPNENTKYIGVLSTAESTKPTDYTRYTWSLIKGADGVDGAQGPQGIKGDTGDSGSSSYLHIKYSNDGKDFTTENGETLGSYIGTYVDNIEDDSTEFNRYTWKKYVGEDGTGLVYSIQTDPVEIFYIRGEDGFDVSSETVAISCYLQKDQIKEAIVLNNLDNIKIQVGFPTEQTYHWEIIPNINEDDLIITTANDNQVSFNLKNFLKYSKSKQTNESEDGKILYIYDYISESGCLFKIEYFTDNTLASNAQTYISLNHKVGAALAEFSVNADNITAAINAAKLKFDENGLSIEQGGLKVFDANGESALNFDENTGKLVISGDLNAAGGTFSGSLVAAKGTFSGELSAAKGTFNGDISAASGTIGGFKIAEGKLISEGTYKQDGEEVSYIELNGKDGSIIANNITLGTGAVIQDYILLSSIETESEVETEITETTNVTKTVKLWNPSKNKDGYVMSVDVNNKKVFYIKDSGVMQLGDITFNGADSSIKGNNWTITNDKAAFSNIEVSGTISTSVFKINSTQCMAGSTIFKPSVRFKREELKDEQGKVYFITTLENNIGLEIGDYVQLSNGDSSSENEKIFTAIESFDEKTLQITFLQEEGLTTSHNTLVFLGRKDSSGNPTEDLIIGINSANDSTGLLPGKGLTMKRAFGFTTKEDGTETINYKLIPDVFLGDLSSLNTYLNSPLSGFGLYATNVYLKGSLTTANNKEAYAGVNTASGVKSQIFENEDIVFWGGAESDASDNIANAPFHVTSSGSLYASKGKFSGSIITDSIIQGASIYAANLYGGKQENEGALNIHDARNGINFIKTDNNGDKKILLSIGSSGLLVENQAFIDINGADISFIGKNSVLSDQLIIKLDNSQSEYASYRQGGIFIEREYQSEESIEKQILSKLEIDTTSLKFSTGSEIASFSDKNINLLSNKTQINNTFVVTDGSKKIEFRPTNNGYDVYVE